MMSSAFSSGRYLPKATNRILHKDDIIAERDAQMKALVQATEPVQVYRTQGSIAILNELIDVLEKGVAALAPDARTSV